MANSAQTRLRELLFIVLAILTLTSSSQSQTKSEVTIFDSEGNAAAYLAVSEGMTIYLWSGEPVAYVDNDDDELSIYGFNGKHLGWMDDGVLIDHKGNAVGFLKGALKVQTKVEPIKAFKQFRPFKSFKEFAPFKPFSTSTWSSMPLAVFLGRGTHD